MANEKSFARVSEKIHSHEIYFLACLSEKVCLSKLFDLFSFPKHACDTSNGEKHKMATLKGRICSGIQCDDIAIETVCISSTHYVQARASHTFVQSFLKAFKKMNLIHV